MGNRGTCTIFLLRICSVVVSLAGKLICINQEDVNGEKLTVKKWWIFGADFFTVWCRFFTVYANFSRFIRDINGEKKISLLMIVFSRLVFHGLPPLK